MILWERSESFSLRFYSGTFKLRGYNSQEKVLLGPKGFRGC